MIIHNYLQFIDTIYTKLQAQGIDTNQLQLDHLGYQVDSASDYNEKITELSKIATHVSENIVGGRRVGIFKLNKALDYKNQKFRVVEIFEPRAGQLVKSDWEHIEFTLDTSLEAFMEKYPQIGWDTSMINRAEFPMLILALGEGLRAKFPRLGVLQEVERLRD